MTPSAAGPPPAGDRAGSRRRDRWLQAAVPLLLAVVATTQIVVSTTGTLTPWRGGGFGMFSTVDAHDERLVRATIAWDAGTVLPVDLASLRGRPEVERAFVTARAWPTQRHLGQLVAAVLATRLTVDDGVVRGADGATADGDLVSVSGEMRPVVHVTVSQTTFDRDRGLVTSVEFATLTVEP